MNKLLIFVMLTFSVALQTDLANAQSGQWPMRHRNYLTPYGTSWNNIYVSPNYNPYINQTQINTRLIQTRGYQNLPGTQSNVGYYSITAATPIPIYGNPLLIPPSMMTYNPWFPGYSVMPLHTLPLITVPTWRY